MGYCEQLYDHKFDNLEEINQLLENHKLSKFNQNERWSKQPHNNWKNWIHNESLWKINLQTQMV